MGRRVAGFPPKEIPRGIARSFSFAGKSWWIGFHPLFEKLLGLVVVQEQSKALSDLEAVASHF
jgi:hypothetical protein